MIIWLASGNKHKQQEVASILAGHTIKLPADAGITGFNPKETGKSFAENALIKARALFRLLNSKTSQAENLVLADDSGLCVDSMGGRPGIYSARYYGKDSWNGDESFRIESVVGKLKDEERNLLLLEELASAPSHEFGNNGQTRTCHFVCAMALLFSPDRFYLVQETMEGEIVSSADKIRGTWGFGYDPIVYLPELGRTVAELSEEEKNLLSHRGKASRIIAKFLQ